VLAVLAEKMLKRVNLGYLSGGGFCEPRAGYQRQDRTRKRKLSRCASKPFRVGRGGCLKEEESMPGLIENRGKRSSCEGNRREIYSCASGAVRAPRGWTGM
jgi:hypothetical protein